MEGTIQGYINYLHTIKKVSKNTELSYKRDLENAADYFREHDIDEPSKVTDISLNSYMLWLEKEKLSPATVSRRVASLRSFFHYLKEKNCISEDPSKELKAPRVEKKMPEVVTAEEIEKLMHMPDTNTLKGIRDRAMLELLYATGIRVSELISLKLSDIDLKRGYIVCSSEKRERWIPFSDAANKAVSVYLDHARKAFLKGSDSTLLFTNCSGKEMSRQGFWKLLKKYASDAGIKGEITPHTLRHSFAIHNLQNGMAVKNVQEMLGHSDISTMAVYTSINNRGLRRIYDTV